MEERWSEREDSNFRPPAPHAGALAKLRHAPKLVVEKYVFHYIQNVKKANITRISTVDSLTRICLPVGFSPGKERVVTSSIWAFLHDLFLPVQ